MKNKLFFVLISLLLVEIIIRLSGLMYTYSEKNYGKYDSVFSLQDNDKYLRISKPYLNTYFSNHSEFEFVYNIDSIGFLGFNSCNNFNEDSTIVILGDSFVFGVGASATENMVSQLQKYDSTKCFYNAGIPGSDPFYQVRLIKEHLSPKDSKTT